LGAVALSVFMIHTLQALMGVPVRTIQREYVEPYRHASGFAAKSAPIGEDLVSALQSSDALSAVYPCLSLYTNIRLIPGGQTGTQVMAFRASDLPSIVQTFGLTLSKGRLPDPGENGVALHEAVARNKGLGVGDSLGSDVRKGEVLEGSYTVCGILSGQVLLSFTSLEYELARRNVADEYSLGVLAVPKDGRLDEMNEALEVLSGDGLILRTLDTAERQFEADISGTLALVSILELAVIVILCLCAGFLSYIQFYVRRGEFATLFAIGYARSGLLRQAFAQIVALNLAGFALGFALSALASILLNALLFFPLGLAMPVSGGEALIRAACAPLFTATACFVPSWRVILALDPVNVLEGRG
ncbi:MAG TPA: ABC transporter permease, partial [Clostridia bacterium]|nr:ABC transporter permease [Clostridia bacterium]